MPTLEFDDTPLEELTIDTALENRAGDLAEKPFVFYGPEDRTVSYEEMDRIANSIGNALCELGVEKGDSISVMLRDPLSTLFTFFGIVKAGAVYSPINYDYKGQALSYQINDTDPRLLIIEDRYLPRLNDVKADLTVTPRLVVRSTDDGDGLPAGRDDALTFERLREGRVEPPDINTDWDDVASILYTSGTTGDPKGVSQQHRWIISNYSEFGWRFQSRDDVTHTSLPLYHVGGLYNDILGSMITGASVALWDNFSPENFWDRVDKYQASRTLLLSSMIPWLVNNPEREDDHRNSLDKVLLSPLPENHREIAKRFGFDVVQSTYGSTEVGAPLIGMIRCFEDEYMTPEAFHRGLTPDELIDIAAELDIPVVREAPGKGWIGNDNFKHHLELDLVNERDESVPIGEVGQLVARPKKPAMLFKEYDGKPTETVESWRNLWYHTGDAMYCDENDNYYFVDRIGTVIRRRGENISSGQVQDIVNSHESIGRSAAFPVPAEEGDEDEVAVAIEVDDDAELDEAELRSYLEENMPRFMIPKYIEFVDEIPTTETNKMEKYKLREDLVQRHSLE